MVTMENATDPWSHVLHKQWKKIFISRWTKTWRVQTMVFIMGGGTIFKWGAKVHVKKIAV